MKSSFTSVAINAPAREMKPFKDNEACFFWVNQGDFSVRTPDEFIPLSPGSGLLAKCFNFFFETTAAQRAQNPNYEFIGVFLYPSIVEDLLEVDLGQSQHHVDYNLKQVQVDKLLNNFKESIELLLDNPELADDAIVKTKLKEFILLISKLPINELENMSAEEGGKAAKAFITAARSVYLKA